jgi:hypothetical protein
MPNAPETKNRLSAIASNAVIAAMDIHGRVIMTDADAEARDAIHAILLRLQPTAATAIDGDRIPLVASPQGARDVLLADISSRLADEPLRVAAE